MSANRNAEKLTKNKEETKQTIEEGKAIMQRINKRRDQKN